MTMQIRLIGSIIIILKTIYFCGGVELTENRNLDPTGVISVLHPRVLKHLLHVELNRHIQILGNVSDDASFLKRTFLDDGHKRAATLLQDWMLQAGLSTRLDAFGNVRGRVNGTMGGPALLIGSHYDTIVDGGKYDGALGILVGIAALKAILLEAAVKRNMVQNERLLSLLDRVDNDLDLTKILKSDNNNHFLSKPVEVIGFSDEEGVRFQSTFLGSRGISGYFTENLLSDIVDKEGYTLLDLILRENLAQSVEEVLHTAVGKNEYAGYLEIHIEQGPLLEREGQPLGVVSGISGQSRGQIIVSGHQGHAGTVPMKLRKDPLPGAAFLIHHLEKLCLSIADEDAMSLYPSLGKDHSLVCSVGSLNVWPGASNVIPGEVNFTVDIRSLSDSSRLAVLNTFRGQVFKECSERGLRCSFEILHEAKAISMDQALTERLETAIRLSHEDFHECQADSKVLRMSSGAGHDALAISQISPVSMLFVRCKEGVSHHPDEFVDPDDVSVSSRATFHFIQAWLMSNISTIDSMQS